jgi:hypothetical protein
MSYKYPQLGIGNLVYTYFIANITCDDDVWRMLGMPHKMMI